MTEHRTITEHLIRLCHAVVLISLAWFFATRASNQHAGTIGHRPMVEANAKNAELIEKLESRVQKLESKNQ